MNMGVSIFPSKNEVAKGQQFLRFVHRTSEDSVKMVLTDVWYSSAEFRTWGQIQSVFLYRQNKWFSESDLVYAICAAVYFGHPLSTELKKEMDFVCGTLSHAVKCLNIITLYITELKWFLV